MTSVAPSLDDVELLEPEHRYRHKPSGIELPGVTHTMREHGIGFQGYAPESALRRGTYVHAASVLIDEDDLEESTVPADWRGYLEAYRRAVRDRRARMIAAEWRFWHPLYWYAGTLDRIAFIDGRRKQVELKTGDHADVDIQTALYDRGWNHWNPDQPLDGGAECWKLNADGTYYVVDINLEHGWRVGAACLVIEERRRQNGTRNRVRGDRAA